MNILSFQVEPINPPDQLALAIIPVIDAALLTTLVEAYEVESGYDPPGGYGGIVPEYFDYGPLDRYFIQAFAPSTHWARVNGIWLLGCDCGEVGCWPLQCRVSIAEDLVTWCDFAQPHRPQRDYSRFGPFHFQLQHYVSAAADLQAAVAR